MSEQARVVFMPSGRRGDFPLGTSLLDAARSLGVDLDSVCGGRGICGRCQISPMSGQFAKHGISSSPENLSPVSEPELRYQRRRHLDADRRLGCHTKIVGDLVIDVPPESQIHRQVVRKEAEQHDITLNPLVHLYYVEVEPPSLEDQRSDLGRLLDGLSREWDLNDLEIDLEVLKGLQQVLRKADWSVTVAVHREKLITAVWPGYDDQVFGIAIDIGSTTIAAHACNLISGEVVASFGRMNPQIRFGEDLMSRVSYIQMHPGAERLLTESVQTAVDELVGECVALISSDHILEITVVANPVMHHLFLGINPVQLGEAPFPLACDTAVEQPARNLNLHLQPGCRLYTLPCIAGHVGADTAGVVLAEMPHTKADIRLIVDIGTNAEIILGNQDRLLAASSPTGPAFEGAQLSCGQRATAGAIERIRIDRETLEPRYKVIGCDAWSDEDGFSDNKAGVTGVCGSGIIEIVVELYLSGVIRSDGLFNPEASGRSDRIIGQGRGLAYVIKQGDTPLLLTQPDVRAVQLAKAALYAGIKLLMAEFGTQTVDSIRIAGAFGSHIDTFYAMVLGLIPDCDLERVSAAGNAAGTGARIALLDAKARNIIEELVPVMEKIETAIVPEFQDLFVGAMGLPHTSDEFPALTGLVSLPRAEPQDRKRGRRRTVPPGKN